MVIGIDDALIAMAVSAAAKGGANFLANKKAKKISKMKSKENKRETLSSLLNDAIHGSAELHEHGRGSRRKLGKRKSQSMQDTSDLVRGAFNI